MMMSRTSLGPIAQRSCSAPAALPATVISSSNRACRQVHCSVSAQVSPASSSSSAAAANEPLMVRAARGLEVERAPCWMMRQAGRFQKSYRDLAKRHPSFRERSETTELIVEISLQPWNSFRPDGVILFSDILTPLPGLGVPFDIDDNKGPIIENPIRSMEQLKQLHELDLSQLEFVGRSLTQLRSEVQGQAAVIGFVGSPWTLATYVIEGRQQPAVQEHQEHMITYIRYQIDSGAQCVQIFDSWGGQLPPREWDRWSGPYLKRIISAVKSTHPLTPLTVYANGSGGLLERLKGTGADVVGLDWTVDMADARRRLGNDVSLQGNVDPTILFASEAAITENVREVVAKAGRGRHILNLGHGVLVGTPEESVAHFFDVSKTLLYANMQ
ncbi:MAG: hypothetical protein WDW36_009555 [Sanguina aurantia]